MKISRKSWHYWLINQIFDRPSKSLCIYFWQVPIAAVCFLAFGVVVTILATSIASAVLIFLAQPILLYIHPENLPVTVILGSVSLVVWCAVLDTLNKHFCDRAWNKVLIAPRDKESKPKDKKPSLIYEYIKAKKDKVCPTIEFYWS